MTATSVLNPLALVVAVILASSSQACGLRKLQQTSWKLLWSDEFTGTTLNTNKWEAQVGDGGQFGIPGWGNNEPQWYTNTPSNLRVEGGNLVLEGVRDPTATTVPGKYYTSARVRTLGKYSVGPGGTTPVIKVEARIKLPGGLGLWPAFWMLPSDGSIAGCSGCGRHGGWPSSGEIDIMEAANEMRSTIATIHYGGPWPLHAQSSGSYSLGGASLADTFHVWGIEWTTTQIRWYMDGQLFMVQNSGAGTKNGWFSLGSSATSYDDPPLPSNAPFGTQKFHLLLNLAMGTENTAFTTYNNNGVPVTDGQLNATLATPQAMLVDWVRVWGRK